MADTALHEAVVARARERLRQENSTSGPERVRGAEIFFDACTPPPELVIFGAGHDAVPLSSLGWTLGFAVSVVDVREAFLTPDRFPHARLIPAHFSRFTDLVTVTPRSFIVVMNHNLERDREVLRFALGTRSPYIGLLGPMSRCERLLSGLAAEGFVPEPATLGRVRSPVGLALGAETPEEVALSILGEILAFRRGFGGGPLHGSAGSLHRAGSTSLAARS
jgi:xanthine/CO dehydrogenase XdhC/CoxF family maturation factor